MADRLILDFENDKIIIETDTQTGTYCYPDLKEEKEDIYNILGYGEINITPAIRNIEGFFNGDLSSEELKNKLEEWLKE